MIECQRCHKPVHDIVEYDQSPFHRHCIKELFRKDNPNLSEEKYEEFDKKAEIVDKFELDGNLLIPIVYEKND